MNDKTRGLYAKYVVRREDGSTRKGKKHQNCNFFVLDLNHDPYAAPALRSYILFCRDKYPLLAQDLEKKLNSCSFGLEVTVDGPKV